MSPTPIEELDAMLAEPTAALPALPAQGAPTAPAQPVTGGMSAIAELDAMLGGGAVAPRTFAFDQDVQQAWNTDPAISKWRQGFRTQFGEEPSIVPDVAKYDYSAAIRAGARPDESGHWPSAFKAQDHPNRFVEIEGVRTDTITGQAVQSATEVARLSARAYARTLKVERRNKERDFIIKAFGESGEKNLTAFLANNPELIEQAETIHIPHVKEVAIESQDYETEEKYQRALERKANPPRDWLLELVGGKTPEPQGRLSYRKFREESAQFRRDTAALSAGRPTTPQEAKDDLALDAGMTVKDWEAKITAYGGEDMVKQYVALKLKGEIEMWEYGTKFMPLTEKVPFYGSIHKGVKGEVLALFFEMLNEYNEQEKASEAQITELDVERMALKGRTDQPSLNRAAAIEQELVTLRGARKELWDKELEKHTQGKAQAEEMDPWAWENLTDWKKQLMGGNYATAVTPKPTKDDIYMVIQNPDSAFKGMTFNVREVADYIREWNDNQVAMQVRGLSVGADITEGIFSLVPYMIEFWASGGLASGARKGVNRMGVKLLRYMHKAGQTAGPVKSAALQLARLPVKTLVRGGAILIGGAVQLGHPIQMSRVSAEMRHLMLPKQFVIDKDNRLRITQEGAPAWNAFWYSLGSQYAELAGEAAGRDLVRMGQRLLMSVGGRKMVRSFTTAMVRRAMANKGAGRAVRKMGWDGYLGEWLEEDLTGAMRIAMNLDPTPEGKRDWERLVPSTREAFIRAVVLAFPTGMSYAAGKGIGAYDKAVGKGKYRFTEAQRQQLTEIGWTERDMEQVHDKDAEIVKAGMVEDGGLDIGEVRILRELAGMPSTPQEAAAPAAPAAPAPATAQPEVKAPAPAESQPETRKPAPEATAEAPQSTAAGPTAEARQATLNTLREQSKETVRTVISPTTATQFTKAKPVSLDGTPSAAQTHVEAVKQNVTEFLEQHPEAAISPVFTARNGKLVFEGHDTVDVVPEAMGRSTDSLLEGEKYRIDLEAFSIDAAPYVQRAEQISPAPTPEAGGLVSPAEGAGALAEGGKQSKGQAQAPSSVAELDKLLSEGEVNKPTPAKSQAPAPKSEGESRKAEGKQPWEMTRAEEAAQRRAVLEDAGNDPVNVESKLHWAQNEHQKAVEQALAEGKPVPAEVLADYPNLAKQIKTAPEPSPAREAEPSGAKAEIEPSEGVEAVLKPGESPKAATKLSEEDFVEQNNILSLREIDAGIAKIVSSEPAKDPRIASVERVVYEILGIPRPTDTFGGVTIEVDALSRIGFSRLQPGRTVDFTNKATLAKLADAIFAARAVERGVDPEAILGRDSALTGKGKQELVQESAKAAEAMAQKLGDLMAGLKSEDAAIAEHEAANVQPTPKAEKTPVKATDKENLARRISEASRRPPLEIVKRTEHKGSNGKWYTLGRPAGITDTGETRSFYVALTKDGTTVGKRYDTQAEGETALKARSDAAVEEFYQQLLTESPERVAEQAAYWLKEKTPTAPDKPAAKPVSKATEWRKELRGLKKKRFKVHADEIKITRLEKKLKHNEKKWKEGQGVAWRVVKGQTNRGYRIISVDTESKTAVIQAVKDTGQLADYVQGQQNVAEMIDLVRDKKFDSPVKATAKEKGVQGKQDAPVVKKEGPPAEQKAAGTPRARLAAAVVERLEGDGFKNNPDFFALAAETYGGTVAEGKFTDKEAYDVMEVGVNQYIRKHHADIMSKDVAEGLAVLRKLIAKLPTQTFRSAEQESLQQFSTPWTEAYVAVKALGNLTGAIALEPSAGTGILATFMEMAGATVTTNEHFMAEADLRADLLEMQGFEVTREDAERLDAYYGDRRFDVVAMNPPFSSTGGRTKTNKTKFGGMHVRSAAMLLNPGGRVVAIVGGGMGDKTVTHSAWFHTMRKTHAYRANLLIDGSEYRKLGTTFDNRMLVFDRIITSEQAPIVVDQPIKLDDAAERLRELTDERRTGYRHAESEQGIEGRPTATERRVPGDTESVRADSEKAGTQRPEPTGVRQPSDRPVDPGGRRVEPRPESDIAGRSGQVEPGSDTAPGRRISQGAELSKGVPASQRRTNRHRGLVDNAKVRPEPEERSGGVFVTYEPHKINGPEHPTTLVETKSMSGVIPPDIDPAHIHLPAKMLTSGALSGVQIEAIAYAEQANQQRLPDGSRRAHFIGDGTGVGKGREIAGVIANNWEQGNRRAVWLSANHKELAAAAAKDFADIGMDEIAVKPIDKFKAIDKISLGDGVIIMGYATLRSEAKAKGDKPGQTRLDQLQEWLTGGTGDPVIIMDEAHKGQNAVASGGGRGGKASEVGMAMVALQNRLPDGKVTYASATGADKVDNLGYAVRMGLWGPGTSFASFGDFKGFMDTNGLGAMEMMARDLKAMGQYSSRLIDFDGVEYDERRSTVSPEMISVYNDAADVWNNILSAIETAKDNEQIGARARAQALGQFWGSHQRFFKQLLTAFKVSDTISSIEESLAAGEAPIVSLDTTGEAGLARAMANRMTEGDDLESMDVSNKDAIYAYLDTSFPTQLHQEVTDDDGNTSVAPVWRMPNGSTQASSAKPHKDAVPVTDPQLVAAKAALAAKVENITVPGNPLDLIILHFGPENVAELTGRKVRLERQKDGTVKPVKRKVQGERDIKAFQSGKKQIAVISRKAAQGISLHAARDAKNQKRRRMILMEMGWQTKDELQKLGRVHRSNQVSAPVYTLSTVDVGGDTRFSANLAANLAKLGALQRGERRASGAGKLEEYDFFNPQGVEAIVRTYADTDQTVMARMGILDNKGNIKQQYRVGESALKGFFNRMMNLRIADQRTMFDTFLDEYDKAHARAQAAGRLDAGVADIEAESIDLIEEHVVRTDKSSGAQTKYYRLMAKIKNKRLVWGRVAARIESGDYGVWRNKRSGHVALVSAAAHWDQDSATGRSFQVHQVIRARATKGVVEHSALEDKWEKLPDRQAESAWNEQVNSIPDIREEEIHVIGGVVLPVFNRISGDTKVVRVPLGSGERIVGVQIEPSAVHQTLAALGVHRGTSESVEPRAIYDEVIGGARIVALIGGYELKPGRYHGQVAIELTGVEDSRVSEMRDLGLIATKVAWKWKLYVPATTEEGVQVIQSLVERYPIIEADKSASENLNTQDTPDLNDRAAGGGETLGSPAQSGASNEIDRGQLSVSMEPGGKPATAHAIVDYLSRAFQLTMRGKATHNKKALGWYDPKARGVRLRDVRSITQAIHELGHYIDWHLNERLSLHPPSKEIADELMQLGKDLYGDRKPPGGYRSEGWAEFIREYLTGDQAPEKAPALHEWFTDTYLPGQAEIAKKLAKARKMITVWRMQGAEARVEASINRKPLKGTLPMRIRRMGLWIDTAFRDELAPLRSGLKRAGIKPGELRPDIDPYELAVAYADKSGSKARQFVLDYTTDMAGNRSGQSLRDAVAPVSKEIKAFTRWVKAARSLDLWDRDINPGISRADAQFVYDKYVSAKWKRAAKDITDWNHRVLDYLVESGGMEADTAKRMKEMNPVYVPFLRAFAPGEVQTGGGAGRGLTKAGKPVKAIKGSGRETVDPFESMIQQTEKIISTAHKADIARAIANLADRPGMAELIWKVPAPIQATRVSAEQLKNDVVRLAVERLGVDPESIATSELMEEWDDILTVYSNAATYYGKDNIVTLVRNGQREFYEVDPALYRVLNGLDTASLPWLLNVTFGKATRAVRLGATGLNASFGLVRNAIRDSITFTVLSKHAKAGPISAASGIVKDVLNTPSARRFKAMGGKMSGQIGHDRTATQHLRGELLANTVVGKAIYHTTHPISTLRELFGISEAGTRIGEFAAALKYAENKWGKGSKAATVYALNAGQDVTTNFTRHGYAAKYINQVVPFFNAAIQGPDKIVRTFKERPIQTTLWAIGFLTVPAIYFWWKYKDEEWYQNLPAYEKVNYQHVEVPGEDKIIRWPVPFELGHIFQSLPVAWLDGQYRDDPDIFNDAFVEAGKQANPVDWPALFGPIIDVERNKDFADRPIVPTSAQHKLPEDQVKPHTTQLMRIIGARLGISPAKLEHLINSYSGGLYGRSAKSVDQIFGMEPNEFTISDAPVIGTLFLRDPYAPKAQIRKFYDDLKLLKQKKGSDKITAEENKKRLADGRIERALRPLWKKLRSAHTVIDRKMAYRKIAKLIAEGAPSTTTTEVPASRSRSRNRNTGTRTRR